MSRTRIRDEGAIQQLHAELSTDYGQLERIYMEQHLRRTTQPQLTPFGSSVAAEPHIILLPTAVTAMEKAAETIKTLEKWMEAYKAANEAASITKDAPQTRAVTERKLIDPDRLAHRKGLAEAFLTHNVVSRITDYTIGMIEVQAGGEKILFLSVSGSFDEGKINSLKSFLGGGGFDALSISQDIDELRLITSAGPTAREHYRYDCRRFEGESAPYECSETTLAAEIKKIEQECKKDNISF